MNAEELKQVRCYLAKILQGYKMHFDNELIGDLVQDLYASLLSRGYAEQFMGSRSTLLYLEAKTTVLRHFSYHNRIKRQATAEGEAGIAESFFRRPGIGLDAKIDLKALLVLLGQRAAKVLGLISQGYEHTEISKRLGISVSAIEKILQEAKCDASVFYETPDAQGLVKARETRRQAKLDRDRRYREGKRV